MEPAINHSGSYPLERQFRLRVLPVLLALLAALVVLAVWGGGSIVNGIYLSVATRRAESIAADTRRRAGDAWRAVMASDPRKGPPPPQAVARLHAILGPVASEADLRKLKVYDAVGRTLYSTHLDEIGTIETSKDFRRLAEAGGGLVSTTSAGGRPLYELYVPVAATADTPPLVFELYEPADQLNQLLWRSLAPMVLVPGLLLGTALALLVRLVGRAQGEIDRRSAELASAHQRLSRFVSAHAVAAAKASGAASRGIDATLYYADLRGFTSLAEENPPEAVIAFLNRILAVQIEEVVGHGGDVDKMMGDALLAVFEGPDRTARAIACARRVLTRLEGMPDLARRLAIGVHDGYVVSGAVGPPERQDFTVIGDGVNLAARLCAAAGPDELVVDSRTYARAGHPDGFTPPEEVAVKGRAEPVRLRRWRPEMRSGVPAGIDIGEH